MNNYKKYIVGIFNEYKCKNIFDELKCIPVYNNKKLIYAYLVPITFQYKLTSPEYVHLLSEWRRNNPIGFSSIFKIDDIRTEKWIDGLVLNREDRILFMIETFNRKKIGHLGYSSFNFEQQNCEIDNVVRGVKGEYPGIMKYAMNSILYWGIKKLKLRDIFLRVLSDNKHAINFYKNCGFTEIKKIPLFKVETKGEIKWVEKDDKHYKKPDRFYSYMQFDFDCLDKNINNMI